MRRRQLVRLLVPGLFASRLARAGADKDSRIDVSTARIRATIEAAGLTLPLKKPNVRIRKQARTLELFDGDTLVKRYAVSLGLVPEGHKEKQGDYRTPEGRYFICNRNYASAFHLFLGLNYPNASDARAALAAKRIDMKTAERLIEADVKRRQPDWYTALGGAVGIHGGGVGGDWTWGCVAVSDDEIEELWAACPWGTPVEIMA